MEGYSRGSNKRKIAICSTNCVQMWKGRDKKNSILHGEAYKNVEPKMKFLL